jgi:hypothetical protein
MRLVPVKKDRPGADGGEIHAVSREMGCTPAIVDQEAPAVRIHQDDGHRGGVTAAHYPVEQDALGSQFLVMFFSKELVIQVAAEAGAQPVPGRGDTAV